MGANEARHVLSMLDDLERVLGLELFVAAQALDVRQRILGGEWWPEPADSKLREIWSETRQSAFGPGNGTRAAFQRIREEISYLKEDREIRLDIDAAIDLVRSGAIRASVEEAVGPLA